MKLVRYATSLESGWGILSSEGVRALGGAEHGEAAALEILAARGNTAPAPSADLLPASDITLLAPIAQRATVYCIGLNYKSHVEETGNDLPAHPTVFIRTQESLVGPGAAMVRPRVSSHFDFEGELAVVIGRGGRYIEEREALAHIGALTCFNDGSLRDFQKHSLSAGKNFYHSGACGPHLVTADEVGNVNQLKLRTRLNGQLVQSSSTDMLIYPIARIISYLSQIVELRTGDVIATGTPEGVGARRNPPLWLKAGDVIEVEVDQVGVLRNSVRDER